jgi:hypothetical protein
MVVIMPKQPPAGTAGRNIIGWASRNPDEAGLTRE